MTFASITQSVMETLYFKEDFNMEEKTLTPEEERKVKAILIGAGIFLCAYLGAKAGAKSGVNSAMKHGLLRIELTSGGNIFGSVKPIK